MADVAALRQQLHERDRAIFEAEGRINDLEGELRTAKTSQTKAEAEAARLRRELNAIDERLQKSKRAEKQAVTELQVLRAQLGGAAAAPASTSSASPLRRAESSPAFAPPSDDSLASASVADGGSFLASPRPAAPSAAVAEAEAAAKWAEEQRKTRLWKLTAQIVLESYKVRLEVTVDEKTAFDAISAARSAALVELLGAVQGRLAAMQHTASMVNKLAEADEAKRIDQFKELTSLRERVIVMEREKAVLDREMVSLDRTVVELEAQVRQLEKDKRALAADRDEHHERAEKLARTLADVATTPPPSSSMRGDGGGSITREAIISHSEMRAELAALREQFAAAAQEKEDAVAALRKSKEHVAAVQERMRVLQGEFANTPTAAARYPTSAPTASSPGRFVPPPSPPPQVELQMMAMAERVADLEALVRHKDQALQVATYQAQRHERGQRYATVEAVAPPSSSSSAYRDPYSRGLRLPSAPNPPSSTPGARSPSRTSSASVRHAQPFRL